MTELLDYSGELFIFFLTFQGVFIRVNHTLITLSSRKLMHSFFFFFFKDEMEHLIQGQWTDIHLPRWEHGQREAE